MEFLLFKYAHLLAFVYWLGGDLGTYFSGNYVVNRNYSADGRGVAFKIMMACDQGPKMSMPLIFPLGLQMTNMMGLVSIPSSIMALIWIVCFIWLGNVVYLHFTDNKPAKAKVAKFDFNLRMVLTAMIVVYAIMGLMDSTVIGADWVAYKMLIFAFLVACGVVVRVHFKPFVPAYVKLMTDGPSDEINETLSTSLAKVRFWVWLIWIGLFINAAIGIHLIP
jgi:hypothetical protein